MCVKQGQGMRERAAPPHPGIYRVPPPPPQVLATPLGCHYIYLAVFVA